MSQGNIFAIGDIHGCADRLAILLQRLSYDRELDTLVFLGDYINRGPDSKGVLDILTELKKECSDVYFLKGNHEQELLEYSATGHVDSLRALRSMGIEQTVASYGAEVRSLKGLGCFPLEHRDFLHSLKFSFLKDDYLFIHADISEELLHCPMNESEDLRPRYVLETSLLSSRRMIQDPVTNVDPIVVFGHIPLASPLFLRDRIGIDTGAVYGNMLTAVQLPQMQFFHA